MYRVVTGRRPPAAASPTRLIVPATLLCALATILRTEWDETTANVHIILYLVNAELTAIARMCAVFGSYALRRCRTLYFYNILYYELDGSAVISAALPTKCSTMTSISVDNSFRQLFTRVTDIYLIWSVCQNILFEKSYYIVKIDKWFCTIISMHTYIRGYWRLDFEMYLFFWCQPILFYFQ